MVVGEYKGHGEINPLLQYQPAPPLSYGPFGVQQSFYSQTLTQQNNNIPLRYYVNREGGSYSYRFDGAFPNILTGIIAPEDYIYVVRQVNMVLDSVNSKAKYSRGTAGALFVAGTIFVVPFIPLAMIAKKKAVKIANGIQAIFDQANMKLQLYGLQWVCRQMYLRCGNQGLRICLNINNTSLINPEKRIEFFKHEELAQYPTC